MFYIIIYAKMDLTYLYEGELKNAGIYVPPGNTLHSLIK